MSNNKILKTLAILCLPIIVDAQILHNNGATFFVNTGATVQVNGGVKNEVGSNWQNNGIVHITDSFVNNQIMPTPTSGTTRFEGTTAQIVSGSEPLKTFDVVFDNANGIALNSNLEINNSATFNNGIVDASTNKLIFKAGATVSNTPTNASHAKGIVVKQGTGAFTFPVGNETHYQPIALNLSFNDEGMEVEYKTGNAGTGAYTTAGSETTALVAHNANEYWQCNPVASATGTATIFWDAYNNMGITDIAHLKVAHLDFDWLNEGTTATGTIGSGSVTSNAISSWSPFTLGSISMNSPLPVTFLSFSGKKETTVNVLNWKTSSEPNNAYFNVQRSTDARNFTTIAKVDSKGEQGNNYELRDENPLVGHNYYRLQQIDLDGKSTLSQVIDLYRDANGNVVNVYPNPTAGMINVELTTLNVQTSTIKLLDMSGRVIKEVIVANNLSQIDMSQLAIGMYQLQVFQNNRVISTQKVEKK